MTAEDKTRRKARMLRAMAAHVLDHGLTHASLRPLAKAAGTSDRMLIYNFGSKDALIRELLGWLATDLAAKLDAALPIQPMPDQRALLDEVLSVMRSPIVGAYVRLWREVTMTAGLGDDAHRETSVTVLGAFVDWLELRMPVSVDDPRAAAETMLTVVEGVHVMDAAGVPGVAEIAIERLYRRVSRPITLPLPPDD